MFSLMDSIVLVCDHIFSIFAAPFHQLFMIGLVGEDCNLAEWLQARLWFLIDGIWTLPKDGFSDWWYLDFQS